MVNKVTLQLEHTPATDRLCNYTFEVMVFTVDQPLLKQEPIDSDVRVHLRGGARRLRAAQVDLRHHSQASQLSCGCLLISFHFVAASQKQSAILCDEADPACRDLAVSVVLQHWCRAVIMQAVCRMPAGETLQLVLRGQM